VIRRSNVAKSENIKVTFALPQDNPSGQVSVVGDFNDWTPGRHVMAKRTNGTRSVSVPRGSAVDYDPYGDKEEHASETQRAAWAEKRMVAQALGLPAKMP